MITLGERLAALEERAGPHAEGPTVGDVLDAHPELAGPLLICWERRHEPPGDLAAATAALEVYNASSPPPPPSEYPKPGSPYDRPSTTTEETAAWH